MILSKVFKYHAPTPLQVEQMTELREEAHVLAKLIAAYVPDGHDYNVAIDKLRECVMFANAGIILGGDKD